MSFEFSCCQESTLQQINVPSPPAKPLLTKEKEKTTGAFAKHDNKSADLSERRAFGTARNPPILSSSHSHPIRSNPASQSTSKPTSLQRSMIQASSLQTSEPPNLQDWNYHLPLGAAARFLRLSEPARALRLPGPLLLKSR